MPLAVRQLACAIVPINEDGGEVPGMSATCPCGGSVLSKSAVPTWSPGVSAVHDIRIAPVGSGCPGVAGKTAVPQGECCGPCAKRCDAGGENALELVACEASVRQVMDGEPGVRAGGTNELGALRKLPPEADAECLS